RCRSPSLEKCWSDFVAGRLARRTAGQASAPRLFREQVLNGRSKRRDSDQQDEGENNSTETFLFDLVQAKPAGIRTGKSHEKKNWDKPESSRRQKAAAQINNHPAEIDPRIDRGGGGDK